MLTSARRGWFERVLIDLNTQCDFLLSSGALPVANRHAVVPRIRQVMNWARLQQVPIVSSLEAHRPGETVRGLPPHCVDRSRGQRKLPFTLMPCRLFLQGDNTTDVPLDPFRRYQQVIFTKRRADFLSNPKADRLINALQPDYWMLLGVTASACVKAMALGLLVRHQRVMVVRDACGDWSIAEGDHAFRQMDAKGILLVTAEEVLSGAAHERMKSHRPAFIVEQESEEADAAAGNGRPKSLEERRRTEIRRVAPSNGNGHPRGGSAKASPTGRHADGAASPDAGRQRPLRKRASRQPRGGLA